jgi:hypothetical protein
VVSLRSLARPAVGVYGRAARAVALCASIRVRGCLEGSAAERMGDDAMGVRAALSAGVRFCSYPPPGHCRDTDWRSSH